MKSKTTPRRFTMSAEQIHEHARRNGLPPPSELAAIQKPVSATMTPETAQKPNSDELDGKVAAKKGTGVRQKKEMNATERGFHAIQEARIRRSELESVTWEGLTFMLPGGVRYKVDFVLRYRDKPPEFCEIKGGMIWPQDLVRYKVAADVWSWLGEFQLWQRVKGTWTKIR